MVPLVAMTGGCLSLTVTPKLQAGPAELVQVIVVPPTGEKNPEAWSHVTVPQPAPDGVATAEAIGQAGGEAVPAAVGIDDGARQGRRPKRPTRLDPAAEAARSRDDDVWGWLELAGAVELALVLPAPDERVELNACIAQSRQLARRRHEGAS